MCSTQGKGRVEGTCCTIHVTICFLSKSLAPQACGFWKQTAGLRRWSYSSSSAWSRCTNIQYRPASTTASLFWSQLYHHEQYKQPVCATGICWDGKRMQESKHKQQGTSTAITGINKGSTRATAERGHHIGSQSQHIKYKCC